MGRRGDFMKFGIRLVFLGSLVVSGVSQAATPEMTPFLSAQVLKDSLNSKDPGKLGSAVSYVGGIADYLMSEKKICPPPGATVATAATLVKADLNQDTNEYRHLSAATPVTYALRMAWGCK